MRVPASGTDPDRTAGHDGSTVLTAGALRTWQLPAPEGSKDARGRLLVVGGSRTTPGGVLLAAEAAMRSGAGKLQIATVTSVAVGLGLAIPEGMVVGLPENADGDLDPCAAGRIVDLAAGCHTVLLGPGIANAPAAAALLERVVPQLQTTVVIDALGMAYLTGRLDGVRHLNGHAVLTPNLGELARTLDRPEEEIRADPLPAIRELSERAGAVVVSGLATSWIVAPDGRVWRDESGGPGLGASGSGDVKAGVIAGLAVRGGDPAQATAWATYAHGRAGERLAAQVGSVGYLARELMTEIPRVLSEVGSR